MTKKPARVLESEDRYTRTQASACFILSIQDRLLGDHSISEHYVSETKLFKGGSGVGTNFSSLRGINEGLASGGQSSGDDELSAGTRPQCRGDQIRRYHPPSGQNGHRGILTIRKSTALLTGR